MAKLSPRSTRINHGLIDELIRYKNEEEAAGERFKVKAYEKVIAQLVDIRTPINTLDDLKEIKGLGKGLKQKIEEYLEKGPRPKVIVDKINKVGPKGSPPKKPPTETAMEDLQTLHGIGVAKAKELISKGIMSIEQLKNDPSLLNSVVQIKKGITKEQLLNGTSPLNKKQIALKYVDDSKKRIPREEMILHDRYLHETVDKSKTGLLLTVVGSYRRGLPTSGDIDVFIAHPKDDPNAFVQFVELLKREGYIIDELSFGEHKFLGLCRLNDEPNRTPRRLDILFTTMKKLPFAVLYFTGSQNFNILMRGVALSKGYSLSEHGFKVVKTGELLDQQFTSEREIFDFLGMAYVEPTKRLD